MAAVAILLCCATIESVSAQDITAQLSTRETWVGQPVVLQIQIRNATDFEPPELPEIGGCDVRSAGMPRESSQITIINGRRSESRSVTLQYLITPRRAGTFAIPPLSMKVDGRNRQTEEMKFVATQSETGDLLFAEITGNKSRVYVGQPLELKLKIWIKPFRDPERQLTLSEANMWQLIADQTAWGMFADRLRELAQNNQRPAGREVLRDDGNGNDRSYFLYEIDATNYPTRPGRIDGDEVQIVVNYPVELGAPRDPFAGLLDNSPFGGSPLLKRMMDDDFFSSPFGNRLTVSRVRPIAAGAKVDATEIVPVPESGRPVDYRGAVGNYQIVTQATPVAVNASDPITLNVGIAGTGPMELVQAPPLSRLQSLTANFKVADESLAGIVQTDTKVFTTTIRPRHEGITEIPAIPFSFFDPDSERFETVYSEPISITVDASDSLSMDSIVGSARNDDSRSDGAPAAEVQSEPDFTNSVSAELLVSTNPKSASSWWIGFLLAPPFIWLATLMVRHWNSWTLLPRLRSPGSRCLAELSRAHDPNAMVRALIAFIAQRTGKRCQDAVTAIGALRTAGMYELASKTESLFDKCEKANGLACSKEDINRWRDRATEMFHELATALKSNKRIRIRRPRQLSSRVSAMLLAAVCLTKGQLLAEVTTTAGPNPGSRNSQTLTESQQRILFDEANDMYQRAIELESEDSAEAKALFARAAEKYQMLVDSPIHNSGLYLNLANAFLKQGQIGKAIANYERARVLDPGNRRIARNLRFADSLVTSQVESNANLSGDKVSLRSALAQIKRLNESMISTLGRSNILIVLALSSVLYWGVLVFREVRRPIRILPWATAPLILLTLSTASLTLAQNGFYQRPSAVVIAETLTIRSGDGPNFAPIAQQDKAIGQRVEFLAARGGWYRIRATDSAIGWVEAESIEIVNPATESALNKARSE